MNSRIRASVIAFSSVPARLLKAAQRIRFAVIVVSLVLWCLLAEQVGAKAGTSRSLAVARRIAPRLQTGDVARNIGLRGCGSLRVFVYDLPERFSVGLVRMLRKLNVKRPLMPREIGDAEKDLDWLDPLNCFRSLGHVLEFYDLRERCCTGQQGPLLCWDENYNWKKCGCGRKIYARPSNCTYGRVVCTEHWWHPDHSLRAHHAAEAVILNRFLSLPAAAYTDDIAEANLFVVPYLGKTDCMAAWADSGRHPMCSEYECLCALEQQNLFDLLSQHPAFSDPRLRPYHVFLFTSSLATVSAGPPLDSLLVHFGPRPFPSASNHLLVPPLVQDEELQPGGTSDAEGPRDVFVFLCMGMERAGAKIGFRIRLWDTLQEAARSRPHLKFAFHRIYERTMLQGDGTTLRNTWAELRRSIFCPTPPGDNPVTTRFFRVLLSGCIPVILVPAASKRRGGRRVFWSWRHGGEMNARAGGRPPPAPLFRFANKSFPAHSSSYAYTVADSLPFSDQINYEDMIVFASASRVHDGSLASFLESLPEAEIRDRQAAIARYRHKLLYSHGARHDDAFSALLREVCERVGANHSGSATDELR